MRRLLHRLTGPFVPKATQIARIPEEIFELAHAQRPSWPRLSAVAAAQGPVNDATKTAEEKDLEEKIDKARNELLDFLKEKENASPDPLDKSELEKREKELAEKVDRVFELAKNRESEEVKEFREALEKLEEKLEEFAKSPTADPKSATQPSRALQSGEFDRLKSYRELARERSGDDRFAQQEAREANVFLDMKLAAQGDRGAIERIDEMRAQIGGDSGLRMKAWATGDLEDVDLVMPDIQEALPYLRAEQRVVSLFRELRTTSPAVEFPRFLSGLDVGHHDDQTAGDPADKVESDPEFDLLLARVYTIAGTTQVPNSTLEDFPAARAWIATELGRATGIQEAIDVLEGDGVGEPLGLLRNGDIPRIGLSLNSGRGIINAVFRAAQDVRFNGHVEPSDVVLAPPVWTDVVLSFESNIGYLYGPPQGDGAGGPPADAPKPRILGLPVTQEPYITDAYGSDGGDYPIVVGQFMDGIVIRRSPFRVDVDTSLGFRKNRTWFRGEERMGFVVVRPPSFEIVEGATGGTSDA